MAVSTFEAEFKLCFQKVWHTKFSHITVYIRVYIIRFESRSILKLTFFGHPVLLATPQKSKRIIYKYNFDMTILIAKT